MVGGRESSASMRLLVRHQWVRDHGTPRVTTLTGERASARALWLEWLQLTGRAEVEGCLFEQPGDGSRSWLDEIAPKAAELAVATPHAPVAIVVAPGVLTEWLGCRHRRISAFIAEGVVEVEHAARVRGRRPRAAIHSRARSLAELTLYEALEATPSTAGRFHLNQSVSFNFGPKSAEIDLLSRGDEIAIEVDGYHHFTDAEHYRRDRRKDLLLQAHGYAVLRFLAEDVLVDARAAIRMVVELLGHKRARAQRRKP